MTSRQRVETALEHREPDRVPLDLGGTSVSGMHASSVYRLRQALRLDPPGTPVRVREVAFMLGEIDVDLLEAIGADVVSLRASGTRFGFPAEPMKEWRLPDGTPVLVPAASNTEPQPDGSIVQYPEGDRSVPPSAIMPAGGWYFDAIIRQPPIDEDRLDPADNLEEFHLLATAELDWYEARSRELERTGRAIVLNVPGTGFGDIGQVPAVGLRNPRGIRDIEEWYVSLVARRDYVRRVFEGQCTIALKNLEAVHARVGDRASVIMLSGTDFGAQEGLFISRETYRELFLPFHREIAGWVHRHTRWKTLIHSCGSVVELIPDFVEAGFDILNPVQTSAAGMDPVELKERFGRRVSFWGGGIDTQRTLPFGSPEQVAAEVRSRLAAFAPGGGFVFTTIHNAQAKVPVENLLALYETVRKYGSYR